MMNPQAELLIRSHHQPGRLQLRRRSPSATDSLGSVEQLVFLSLVRSSGVEFLGRCVHNVCVAWSKAAVC